MKNVLSRFLSLIVLAGCAGQRPPEGGPVDTVPPEIISVFPQPNTVNFSEQSILLEFNEYVDRRSTEEAIFISPAIEEKEFEWSGTELEITLNEELRKNTTYVVTVGTDVIDIRARNRMANSFTLSFSTGPKIDNGAIVGKVFDEKSEGVMIFSYRIDNILADTLNPAVTKPDYLTQTGKDGEFLLKNLASGKYRVFAIRDEYRNLLYDPETDDAGTTDDIILTENDTLKSGIAFTVAKKDTTPPRLSSVQAPDDHHVTILFSEPMDTASVRLNNFIVSDTLFQRSLPLRQLFPNNDLLNSFSLVTEKQSPDERYVVMVRSVTDRNGFVINPLANTKQFNGSSVRDTIPPALTGTVLKDPAAIIFPNDPFWFTFNDALQPLPDSALLLRRARDSSLISTDALMDNPAKVTLVPTVPVSINEQLLLTIHWKKIKDLFGNSLKDSVTGMKFITTDPENYGSIQGAFAGLSATSTIIQAENINDRKQAARKVKPGQSGAFNFSRLPEGRYILKAFEDNNGNMVQDAGTVFPFLRAERFSFYKDTIRVRARWPVDGVLFKSN
ncbi:MAG: Ig-like domain-containing protein [Bacteroidota bacterium]